MKRAALLLLLLAGCATQPHTDQIGGACDKSVGVAQARRYVERCRMVSPATHPPCHAQNSCALIIGEIKRGCALIRQAGSTAPDFCAQYR